MRETDDALDLCLARGDAFQEGRLPCALAGLGGSEGKAVLGDDERIDEIDEPVHPSGIDSERQRTCAGQPFRRTCTGRPIDLRIRAAMCPVLLQFQDRDLIGHETEDGADLV